MQTNVQKRRKKKSMTDEQSVMPQDIESEEEQRKVQEGGFEAKVSEIV
jgi:hypothetical protein